MGGLLETLIHQRKLVHLIQVEKFVNVRNLVVMSLAQEGQNKFIVCGLSDPLELIKLNQMVHLLVGVRTCVREHIHVHMYERVDVCAGRVRVYNTVLFSFFRFCKA